MSKELHKTDVEPASSKPAPKTEGATIAKQGIKVQGVGFFLFFFFAEDDVCNHFLRPWMILIC